MKALSEATELRVDEKEFYDNAFLQTKKYVPPDSDRAGNTVGDLAPEVFDSKYHGRQDSSSGILGLLEVILSDFDRTDTTVTDEEKTAAEKFEEFKKATEEDIDAKKKDRKTKKR